MYQQVIDNATEKMKKTAAFMSEARGCFCCSLCGILLRVRRRALITVSAGAFI